MALSFDIKPATLNERDGSRGAWLVEFEAGEINFSTPCDNLEVLQDEIGDLLTRIESRKSTILTLCFEPVVTIDFFRDAAHIFRYRRAGSRNEKVSYQVGLVDLEHEAFKFRSKIQRLLRDNRR